MSIEESIPRLQSAIWERLGDRSHLKSTGLLDKLGGDTGMHPQDVRRALARLQESGWLTGVARNGEPLGHIVVLAVRDAAAEPASLSSWRSAMEQSELTESDRHCLAGMHAMVSGFDDETMRRLAAGMPRVRDAGAAQVNESQFVVSARHLLGSAKLLSAIPAAILRKFLGWEPKWIEQIPYVVTAGPAVPESVILIENPWAFERAIELGVANRHALLVTFGYGLSRNGDAFGRQLASQIEANPQGLIQLRRQGTPPDLPVLFDHASLTFWGDLDPEGLRIYMRLKRRLPSLQLSTLYEPMRHQLMHSGGHPFHAATGKEGQVALSPIELQAFPELSELASACARYGLDQEAVDADDLKSYS